MISTSLKIFGCTSSPRDILGDKILWAVLYIHPWQAPCLTVPFAILLTFYCSLHFTVQLRDYSLIGCALYSPLPHCSNTSVITFYSSLHFSVKKGSFNSTVLFTLLHFSQIHSVHVGTVKTWLILKGSLPIFIDTIGNAHSLGEAELLGFNEKKRATKALFCMNQPEIKSVDIADGL